MATTRIKSLQPTKPKSTKRSKTKPDIPEGAAERTEFWCCRCGKKYNKQRNNFPVSQSTIYYGNGGYLPVCSFCVDDLFTHYKASLDSDRDAMMRVCQKFDIYWNESIYESLAEASTSSSRIRAYISHANVYRFTGKTYDDTLDEQRALEAEQAERDELEKEAAKTQDIVNKYMDEARAESAEEYSDVDDTVIAYWGTGLRNEEYRELETRRKYWLSQYPEGTVLDPGADALLRQICGLEIDINHSRAAGRSAEKLSSTLNGLLGSMNLQPSQKKEITEENYIPFGVEIAKWEEERPVIEPDPEFEDVDGFKRNITAWFLGQLCRMVGIKNKYAGVYQEELDRYTIERPKFEDDDDESTFDDMFGRELITPGGDGDG